MNDRNKLITMINTSLVVLGALANRLQHRTARKANEANLDIPNLKTEITFLYSNMGLPIIFRSLNFLI